MKKNIVQYVLGLFAVTCLFSCVKATVFNPSVDENNMGHIKLENVSIDKYNVKIKNENSGNKYLFDEELESYQKEVIEANVGTYIVEYKQLSGYTLWATKGDFKIYVAKDGVAKADIPK